MSFWFWLKCHASSGTWARKFSRSPAISSPTRYSLWNNGGTVVVTVASNPPPLPPPVCFIYLPSDRIDIGAAFRVDACVYYSGSQAEAAWTSTDVTGGTVSNPVSSESICSLRDDTWVFGEVRHAWCLCLSCCHRCRSELLSQEASRSPWSVSKGPFPPAYERRVYFYGVRSPLRHSDG